VFFLLNFSSVFDFFKKIGLYNAGLIIFTSLVIFICISNSVFSQTSIDSVTVLPNIIQKSKFDGVIKTKVETSTEFGVMRFNVRNSRLGLRGDISEYLSYRVQVEFSNEGNFSPLDIFGTLKLFKNFSLLLGQQPIPFENSYIISPTEMMFANRAFLGKYFTPGTRDIGAVVQYRFRIIDFPMETQAGMFNGNRINNPQWTEKPSFAFRLIAGKMDGFRTTAKMYRYTSKQNDSFFWAADIHYATSVLKIETEVMNRHSSATGLNLFGTYIQSSYTFALREAKMFHSLTPVARWDAMGYDVWNKNFDVNRVTTGIHFGLTSIPFDSLLRIDYEHYFVRKDMIFPDFDNRDAHVSDNKVTVELLIRF